MNNSGSSNIVEANKMNKARFSRNCSGSGGATLISLYLLLARPLRSGLVALRRHLSMQAGWPAEFIGAWNLSRAVELLCLLAGWRLAMK